MASAHDLYPTGMVAFVLSDLDASRGPDREEAVPRGRHAAHFDEAVAAHHGLVVDTERADATLAAFSRCHDALRAAVAVQLALRDAGIPARVAVHVADAEVTVDGGYADEVLEPCRRLLAAGHGGQILASSVVAELAGATGAPDVEFADQGVHHLPGAAHPMRIHQVVGPGLPRHFPPLRTHEGSSSTLPRATSPLIGRDAELTTLVGEVEDRRLVTLVGAGGCGKTRLALEVATRRVERYRDGVCWVDLARVTDRDRVDDAAANALALASSSASSPRTAVLTRLARSSTLLVLDNCEHVLDVASDLVGHVLEQCRDVDVLVTSREPLGLHDEVVRRVPSLELPASNELDDVLGSAAGDLLVERIRRGDPLFMPRAEDGVALEAICHQLDGIPLALELAAARVRTMPLATLAARLNERFGLLTGGGRNVLPRQRTLEASVSWSYELLDEHERSVFRRLSIFAGGFTLEAAQAVAGDDHGAPGALPAVMERLVDRSMLEVTRDRGGDRYAMLETLRQFGRERLLEEVGGTPVRDRHLAWFAAFAESRAAGLRGPDSEACLHAIEQELPNLRLAIQWALDTSHGDDACTIVAPLAQFWMWSGRSREAWDWFDAIDRVGSSVSDRRRLDVLVARTSIAAPHGREEFVADCTAGLELAGSLGDGVAEGWLLTLWGTHLFHRGHLDGREVVETGGRILREAGDRIGALLAEEYRASCDQSLARSDLALPRLLAIDDEVRAVGSPRLRAEHLARLVVAEFGAANFDAVMEAAGERHAILGTVPDATTWAERYPAMVDAIRGRADVALERLEHIFARCTRDGVQSVIPEIVCGIALALIPLGRTEEAVVLLEVLWNQPGVADRTAARFMVRQGLAHAALADGRLELARGFAIELRDEALEWGSAFFEAEAERVLGILARHDGEHRVAEASSTKALEIVHGLGVHLFTAGTLEEIGGLEVDHGRPGIAATLFGAAAAVHEPAGIVVRPNGRQLLYEADLAAARAALSTEEFDAAWATGKSMGLDAAVELACRGRGERGRPAFGWDSLTPTELRVATLAAQGLTNQQIADELVMGRETAKTHVARVLRKLDLVNRTQLAAAMSQLESLPEPKRKARTRRAAAP
ncbi:MAG TPA: LuxR C-terminal-related transcriptional regulator [Acidimicrobiia bacterium]|nr:LuxR C-terminal-related transcriptional regulator [Acidimicrobiia bacterium]